MQADNFTVQSFRILDALRKFPEDQIDPILRLTLLRRFLSIMIPASQPIEIGFKKQFDSLHTMRSSGDVNWQDPQASQWLKVERDKAKRSIHGLRRELGSQHTACRFLA